MKKTNTSECPLCGHEDEDVSQFLGQCPAMAQLRGQYFNDYYLPADPAESAQITLRLRIYYGQKEVEVQA
jgi:hypothetical protein